jgi:hypothetical protein
VVRLRSWLIAIALALCAMSAHTAAAQSLDCSAIPQSICATGDIVSLESDRSALIKQLSERDPQNAALGGEQTWLDGLGACAEDVACYRSAYSAHNQSLRESVAALPPADETPIEELPQDPTAFPPLPEAEDIASPPRNERAHDGPVYVPGGPPGWGFFVAIGVTLLLWNMLLRARAKYRRELHADQVRVRERWR